MGAVGVDMDIWNLNIRHRGVLDGGQSPWITALPRRAGRRHVGLRAARRKWRFTTASSNSAAAALCAVASPSGRSVATPARPRPTAIAALRRLPLLAEIPDHLAHLRLHAVLLEVSAQIADHLPVFVGEFEAFLARERTNKVFRRSCASLCPRHWYILYGTKRKTWFSLCFVFNGVKPLKTAAPPCAAGTSD